MSLDIKRSNSYPILSKYNDDDDKKNRTRKSYPMSSLQEKEIKKSIFTKKSINKLKKFYNDLTEHLKIIDYQEKNHIHRLKGFFINNEEYLIKNIKKSSNQKEKIQIVVKNLSLTNEQINFLKVFIKKELQEYFNYDKNDFTIYLKKKRDAKKNLYGGGQAIRVPLTPEQLRLALLRDNTKYNKSIQPPGPRLRQDTYFKYPGTEYPNTLARDAIPGRVSGIEQRCTRVLNDTVNFNPTMVAVYREPDCDTIEVVFNAIEMLTKEMIDKKWHEFVNDSPDELDELDDLRNWIIANNIPLFSVLLQSNLYTNGGTGVGFKRLINDVIDFYFSPTELFFYSFATICIPHLAGSPLMGRFNSSGNQGAYIGDALIRDINALSSSLLIRHINSAKYAHNGINNYNAIMAKINIPVGESTEDAYKRNQSIHSLLHIYDHIYMNDLVIITQNPGQTYQEALLQSKQIYNRNIDCIVQIIRNDFGINRTAKQQAFCFLRYLNKDADDFLVKGFDVNGSYGYAYPYIIRNEALSDKSRQYGDADVMDENQFSINFRTQLSVHPPLPPVRLSTQIVYMGIQQDIRPSHQNRDDPYDADTLPYLNIRPNELKLDNDTYNDNVGWVSLNSDQLSFQRVKPDLPNIEL